MAYGCAVTEFDPVAEQTVITISANEAFDASIGHLVTELSGAGVKTGLTRTSGTNLGTVAEITVLAGNRVILVGTTSRRIA